MKRLIFSILICVFAWGVEAQEIDALFVSMPDKNIPQLEDAWRKDLVDLYKSGKRGPFEEYDEWLFCVEESYFRLFVVTGYRQKYYRNEIAPVGE